MVKLIILEINNYVYILKSENNTKYILNLEFINIDKKVSINNIIYMNKELINEKEVYTFGPLNAKYGKKIELETEKDIAILEINDERIYLQRYYG
jgi:hypothetical protein